jgi:hypothetical protein
MTEELQGALTEILNGVLTAKDFVISELPEVITQLLTWKVCENIVYFTLASTIVGSILYVSHLMVKGLRERRDPCPEFVYFVGCLVSIIPVIVAIECLLKGLQIWLAPKVYLIEYAASLAK